MSQPSTGVFRTQRVRLGARAALWKYPLPFSLAGRRRLLYALLAIGLQRHYRLFGERRFRLRGGFRKGIGWPVTDGGRMRDDTRSFTPMVELVAGRLHGEAQRRPRAEIEHQLMSGARSRSDDGAGEAGFDCAMEMAAKNSFDLRMVEDDFGEGRTTIKAVLVHLVDPAHKRRVVHQHQRRLIRRCRQRTGEPVQALLAQGSRRRPERVASIG